jgi:hypothetical protein
MSDEELDRQWKRSNRPQSYVCLRPLRSSRSSRLMLTARRTMARSFSLALDDLFKMENSIADLDAAVSEK